MNAPAHNPKPCPPNSTCERCGQPFTCHGIQLQACWCADVQLTAEALAELRRRYGRCLCRACLEHFAKVKDSPKQTRAH